MKRTIVAFWIGGMLLAGVVGGVVSRWVLTPQPAEAQATTTATASVVTRQLRVVDANNRTRIFGSTVNNLDGAPGLSFSDSGGRTRAFIGVTQTGSPFLSLNDQEGRPRVEVVSETSGLPAIFLWNDRRAMRATIRMLSDGTTGIAFLDDRENVRAVLEVGRDGRPDIYFVDHDGRPYSPGVAAHDWDVTGTPHEYVSGVDLRDTFQAMMAITTEP